MEKEAHERLIDFNGLCPDYRWRRWRLPQGSGRRLLPYMMKWPAQAFELLEALWKYNSTKWLALALMGTFAEAIFAGRKQDMNLTHFFKSAKRSFNCPMLALACKRWRQAQRKDAAAGRRDHNRLIDQALARKWQSRIDRIYRIDRGSPSGPDCVSLEASTIYEDTSG